MLLSFDQQKLLLEAYFRSVERDPNRQWKYWKRSSIDDLTTEFLDIDLDHESLSRHVLRIVERFRNTGSVCKGNGSNRRTVLKEEVEMLKNVFEGMKKTIDTCVIIIYYIQKIIIKHILHLVSKINNFFSIFIFFSNFILSNSDIDICLQFSISHISHTYI